jgi:hypothetical protein
MPLYPDGKDRIRAQLERIDCGDKVWALDVGRLTDEQFAALQQLKADLGHPIPESPELVYLGRHHYKSRVIGDGYEIEDLVSQVEAAMAVDSMIEAEKHMTALVSAHRREDGYGFRVRDRMILELQQRKPKGEIYSAIPKGDGGGPKKHKKQRSP